MHLLSKILSLAGCALALAATVATADASPRKRVYVVQDESVIVVKPRSWLDPGTQVFYQGPRPYMQQMTYFNRQPLEKYSPGILWKPEAMIR